MKRNQWKNAICYYLKMLGTRVKSLETKIKHLNVTFEDPEDFSIMKNDEGLFVMKFKKGKTRGEYTGDFNFVIQSIDFMKIIMKPNVDLNTTMEIKQQNREEKPNE